ncbi:hypothetical protein BV25DRAFT_1993016 [Artomyces pyxidatus]|uniref:Uncharacterized protein n=1 Tax=Artomyces pyxidatus TaxID=48021 RepID=A0ACB8SW53_9AGAM|nr:hypothetical protein BV25DRAFT_1993016 [Artomyces pyxidatus]
MEMAFPQNAIKSVTLEGVVQDNKTGEFVPVALHRTTAPLDLVHSHYMARPTPAHASVLLESVPVRPPSRLPPPGEAHLHGHLGSFIGDGNCSIVFALDKPLLDGVSPDQRAVPRLVVKIARSNRLVALAREAWFYDDMECLQGSSIARCYGWFEVDLSSGQSVPAWSEHPAEDPDEHDYAIDHDEVIHPDQIKRTKRRDVLSVLLLERLGDKLPPGPHPDSVRSDIMDLYLEVSHLGIGIAEGVRRHNTLAAPHEEPCLPSLISPFTNRTHCWRVVDFEFAVKTNWTVGQFKLTYYTAVRRMIEESDSEEEDESADADHDPVYTLSGSENSGLE